MSFFWKRGFYFLGEFLYELPETWLSRLRRATHANCVMSFAIADALVWAMLAGQRRNVITINADYARGNCVCNHEIVKSRGVHNRASFYWPDGLCDCAAGTPTIFGIREPNWMHFFHSAALKQIIKYFRPAKVSSNKIFMFWSDFNFVQQFSNSFFLSFFILQQIQRVLKILFCAYW